MNPPKLTGAARRVVEQAIRDIVDERYDDAAEALRALIARPKRGVAVEPREFGVKVVPIVREPLPPLAPIEVDRSAEVVTSLSKPDGRIEDPAAILAYRARHPVCEAAGPDCWYAVHYPEGHPRAGCPFVEVHHVVKKSKGGDDVPQNFLALCTAHHTGRVGWHSLTPPVWFARFNDRLDVVAYAKANHFLRTKGWNPELIEVAA